jgi:hypothetical protein
MQKTTGQVSVPDIQSHPLTVLSNARNGIGGGPKDPKQDGAFDDDVESLPISTAFVGKSGGVWDERVDLLGGIHEQDVWSLWRN